MAKNKSRNLPEETVKSGDKINTAAKICRAIGKIFKKLYYSYRKKQYKQYKKCAKFNKKTGFWKLKKIKKIKKAKFAKRKPK